jgi:LytS/YehU family sensor histidine kinase
MMMQLYYFSMINIRRYNALLLEKEEMQAKHLELELESFKAEMKPDLLMECLENLLSIMRKDTRKAEQYIQGLSNQYRYLLDNRQKEFISLEPEMEALDELLGLLNGGAEERIAVERADLEPGLNIIPGTLQNLVFNIENTMILSSLEPMKLSLRHDGDGNLLICHPNRPRLVPGHTVSLEKLNRSYAYYTGRQLEKTESAGEICWIVPALPEVQKE